MMVDGIKLMRKMKLMMMSLRVYDMKVSKVVIDNRYERK